MSLLLDDFVVLGFHGVRDAPEIHAGFKRRGFEAAVVDHAFIISHLHLAVSFYRFCGESAFSTGALSNVSARKRGRPWAARDLFTSLSLSHNLDRILQVLPAESKTSAVLVIIPKKIYDAHTDEVIDCIIRKDSQADMVGKAIPHSLVYRHSGLFPFLEYVDVAKVMGFYGITERDKSAMMQSFSLNETYALAQEVLGTDFAPTLTAFHAGGNICQCPCDRTACAKNAISMMLAAKALEQCVVNKLSLCDV
ncbi:unnamed protein product [Phytomonas sp. Hart1]|nr:unnamed protein product [Phytomonas sp. Hart1]|eukprot:CCW65956.1 unnamed protein product [Phytomonas sp. isolate Hart1]